MTGILYTAFASENQEQKIAHIYVTVQHCRLETETIEKTAQFAHEAYFPLAEFKVSQKSIQSRKQWIKFCRLLVLVPGCCTGKLTGCILGCSHLWSSEPVSSFLSQDRRRNTPSGRLNVERADAERHTDLMWTLFYTVLGNSHNKFFLQWNEGQLSILLSNIYIIYQVQWPFETFPLWEFQFLSGTNILYSKFCTGVWIVVALSWALGGIGVEACHRAGPWEPPKAGIYRLALGTDFIALGTATACGAFCLSETSSTIACSTGSLQKLFYRLQRFHRQQSAKIASFHSDMVSSWQKNRKPPRRPRSGVRHPPPGQPEELGRLFRFSTLNFRITPEYNPGL